MPLTSGALFYITGPKMQKSQQKPFLGFGLGLRTCHYQSILDEQHAIDWFEILTENYLVPGGKPLYYLEAIRERYPLVMHGVSMSIGSMDALDFEYLSEVKKLAERIRPAWISDHLCWTGVNGINLHDLLPLPYTTEAMTHIVSRIQQVQDYLGRQLLIENVSSYLTYQDSEMSEWEFIKEICQRADCLLLLDVNNVYVSSINHEFNPNEYIKHLDSSRIYQIHLAGHLNKGDYLIDTHDHEIIDSVWDLYRYTIATHGLCSTMIERDDDIPQLNELVQELEKARDIAYSVVEEAVA